ncbi:MAG TPA: YceI family protein [Geminicoccus sp.]|jgi:polyisoprenoid-binding protein YceI|uniref:YceI family protein n=1 Tax=Geminicoccus sp. TaxID=2024832 RepID=UPI002E31EECB|nr:YceI family protein [Geminicoccus sp.]HEX2528389.1 YceI family protein [Geminicoccus sp.]
MKRLLTSAALALTLSTAAHAADPWTIDESHTAITFTVDHLGYSTVHGFFRAFDGKLTLDTKAPENSSVEFTIESASLDTLWGLRDEHLKSADFLDVAKFPTITFKSSKVTPVGADAAKVTGDLTIKGVTKPVELDVKLNKLEPSPMTKAETAGFTATTVINRSDFGVSAFVPAVGDELTVRIDTETSPAS